MRIANKGIEICCQACDENDVAVERLGDGALFDRGMYTAICNKCGHGGSVCETRAEALNAWATENRAAERQLIARIGELDAALAAEKNAHKKLRGDAQAARAILADIDVIRTTALIVSDPAAALIAIRNAYQLLDLALDAEAGLSDRKEAAKC